MTRYKRIRLSKLWPNRLATKDQKSTVSWKCCRKCKTCRSNTLKTSTKRNWACFVGETSWLRKWPKRALRCCLIFREQNCRKIWSRAEWKSRPLINLFRSVQERMPWKASKATYHSFKGAYSFLKNDLKPFQKPKTILALVVRKKLKICYL